MATRSSIKEYTAKEIVLATDNFSCRLKSESFVGIWGSVYKGCRDNDAVSVKFLNSSEEPLFESRLQHLRQIGHPHLISIVGFCSELKCFVYEHIECSSSLNEVIKQELKWHDRILIARDICSAMCYIKRARCQPIIVPDYLSSSTILIDRHRRAKVNSVLKIEDDKQDFVWDVKTFGYLVLNLLTGMPGNFISYCYVRCVGLLKTLDKTAGEWPMDLAEKLMNVCRRCVDCNSKDELRKKYIMVIIVKEINQIREKADDVFVRGIRGAGTYDVVTRCRVQAYDIPRQFYCPIYMEVMKDPYVAADGFSYERQGIEKWLQTGHDTSPMTNLKLENKSLTPNGTLKLLIRHWYRERSIPHPNP